jgi:hypothetical protein
MKKLRIILSVFAFVFAITAAYAFVQQQAWFKQGLNPAQLGTITEPANTDIQPCRVQSGTTCKINGFSAYETQAAANVQDPSKLLKYN